MQPILGFLWGIICSSPWSSHPGASPLPSPANKHCPPLPAPLWCRVGNTGIKCKFEADGDAPSAAGHFLHQGYTHLQYLQTSCNEGRKSVYQRRSCKTDTGIKLTASQHDYKFITEKINM